LISPTGEIVVTTHEIAQPESLLNIGTGNSDTDFGLIVAEGEIYQLVVVPVRAPHLIGYVVLGFVVDDALATQLYQLTNTQVTFVARFDDKPPVVVSSAEDLVTPSFIMAASTPERLQEYLASQELRGNWLPLRGAMTLEGSTKRDLGVLISASVKQAAAPFTALQSRLIAIALITLGLAVGVAMLVGQQVVEPVRMLVNVAKRIAGGRYDQQVEVKKQDEIGQLAESFNHMQTAISEREARISHQSFHDLLTDLPNRRFLNDRLSAEIENGEPFVLVVLNLDNFSRLNDMFGQTICDHLLVKLSKRLEHSCEEGVWVAHLHGDEFVLLFPHQEEANLEQIHRVLERLNQPYDFEQVTYNLHVSAGIARFPEGGDDLDTLLRRAQFARVKARHENSSVGLYEAGDDEPHMRKLKVAAALRDITKRNHLSLAYQPQIDIHDRSLHGVEALIRWTDPELGFVSPVEFIPLAEQSGDITKISYWVIEEAIGQLVNWREEGLSLKMSINLSAADLVDPGLIQHIQTQLKRAEVEPKWLTFEVTESLLMVNPEVSIVQLNALKAEGMVVAIDDYGTGYSSLAQMRRLPANELKVDRAFVMHLERSEDDRTIVASTIDMAHRLGFRVVAEGVETQTGWQYLQAFGCDLLQGYYIAKPMPADALVKWINQFDYDSLAPKLKEAQ